ncbi:MAG: DUF2452 domain-containing protein [Pseudomonadota bacterium]
MSNGNPQGKGLVPVLNDWQRMQPATIRHRSARQVLRDYFVGLLVVSAECPFQPRREVDYFLYRVADSWRLSLLSPEDWSARQPGPFLGQCRLLEDMTWSLTPAADLAEQPDLIAALDAFQQGFIQWLDAEGTLEDNLPFYVQELPYYRRLAAAALARSLKVSMAKSGLDARASRAWLQTSDLPRLIR